MQRKYWLIIIIACVCLLAALLFLRGENELLGESNATELPLEGVSLTVSATRRKVEYTIESSIVDYIIYDGYNDSMRLEMLQDGKWYAVGSRKASHDMPTAISPSSSHTVNLKWKDIYEHNMKKGQYRLVYTFWAMDKSKGHPPVQSDNYVIVQEFTLD